MFDVDREETWRVLIVDDEADNLDLLSESLDFYGVACQTAADGASALALAQTGYPNLVLLDLSMPDMSGWEVQAALPDLPAIAVTAHAMTTDIERVRNSAFQGCITKPIDVRGLIDTIKHILKEKRQ